jgi:Prp8 binding protein
VLLLLPVVIEFMMATVQGFATNKRLRTEAGAIVVAAAAATTNTRSSSLPVPTLKLSGHTGSVYALEYSPSGNTLCSASFDKTCLLWSHKDSDEEVLYEDDATNSASNQATSSYHNFNVLTGHKNAVLDCAWCDEDCIVTASADKTLMLWDAATGKRLRKWAEHDKIVNAVTAVDDHLVVSASDDACSFLWDRREKRPVQKFETEFPVLAVAATPEQIFTSGIDPKIYCWDLRRTEHPVYSMSGHTDTVTALALHPESTHVLSNSMDQTLKSWDIRPFCTGKRNDKTFVGHRHHADKGQLLKCSWSADGGMVTGGSSDHRVHIWDERSAQELYDLPGHLGSVNAVTFHPVETTVVASGSSDKSIYVGELS